MNYPLFGYQTSQVNVTQQAVGIPQGVDLVATFSGADYPGIIVNRVTLNGPQVPVGSLCRIYRDAVSLTSQLTVVDRTDANNWTPIRPQRLPPGSYLIVVWEQCSTSPIKAYATMQCEADG